MKTIQLFDKGVYAPVIFLLLALFIPVPKNKT